MDKIKVLSQLDMFHSLRKEELEELAEYFVWEKYNSEDIIVEQDQLHRYFHVLAQGSAQASFSKQGHNSMPVRSYGPGYTFGEVGLLINQPAPSTIKCTTDCKLLVSDSECFGEILVRWPEIYKSLIIKLSKQANKTSSKLLETSYKEFLRTSLAANQLKYKFYDVWGATKTNYEMENAIKRLAKSTDNLLLVGERGTGQQMMAWYIHKAQFGENAPFVVVSGRQFDQLLSIESHDPIENLSLVKEQYLLEVAAGGTLFIRDLNLLSSKAQLKLVQTLQEKPNKCRLMGTLVSGAKVIGEPLIPQLMEYFTQEHRFTPLRDRKRDIPVIAQGILDKLSQRNNRKTLHLDKEATKLLLTHNYLRGNVSELIQIIERSFFLTEGEIIGPEHLFFGPPAKKSGKTLNLLSFPRIQKYILKNIYPLHVKRLIFIIFSVGLILLFLEAKQITSDYGLLLAWSIWWPAVAILSSILGRVWCGVCPFSYFMEMAQKIVHLDRAVPSFVKKYDYIIITFLFCFIFWLEVLLGMRLSGVLTGSLILAITLLAALTGVIFTRHTWCHHLCPLGGFISMSSIGGMLEVRANTEICLNKCTTHECYRGSKDTPGCPMSQHTAFLDNSHACKLCLNCLRSCPNDAVQVNVRVPAREVWHLVRINQGFTIFVGVTLGILIPIVYFEPLHHVWPDPKWQLWFSLAYWGTAITAGLLTWVIAQPFKTKAASRRVKLVFALVPIVIAGYISYHLNFIPGIKDFFISLGYNSSTSNTHAFNLSALTVGRILAAITGVILTSIVFTMVLIRTRKEVK